MLRVCVRACRDGDQAPPSLVRPGADVSDRRPLSRSLLAEHSAVETSDYDGSIVGTTYWTKIRGPPTVMNRRTN